MVVEDRFREIFEGNPALDEILPPNLPALRRFRPQLCVNLHGGTRSAWMTELCGARFRAGFGHYRQQFIYNVRIPRAQEILGVERTVHTAEHVASAMFYLGVPRIEIPRARLVPANEQANVPANVGANAPVNLAPAIPIAVIHAMASRSDKTWPAENFLAVAEHLRETGLDPVFIGGADDDLSQFAGFRTVQGAPLSEIKILLAGAALFVGNDSGPAHMAAAFGLPAVVIFSASDPEIWGPWRTAGEVVRAPAGIDEVLEALERVKAAV